LRQDSSGYEKDQLQHRLCWPGVGIKEVQDDIWLVSFMDYDLGYFDRFLLSQFRGAVQKFQRQLKQCWVPGK